MELEVALRAHGCRVTRARRLVWDALKDADRHLSAPAVAERVHDVDPSINVSSVYRALGVFADLGLVRESHLDGTSTWEPFHDDDAIHLLCTACGTVTHHDTEVVQTLRRTLERSSFAPDRVDIRISGRCPDCRER